MPSHVQSKAAFGGIQIKLKYKETATLFTDITVFSVPQPLLGRPDHPGGGLLPRPPPMQFGGRPPMQNDMGPPGGIPSLLGPPPPMPFRMMPPGGE